MSRWSPRDLPKARRQTADFINEPGPGGFAADLLNQERSTDPITQARVAATPGLREEVTRMGRQLQAAELFWASADMTALAMAAGQQLPRPDLSAPPAPIGIIVFEKGLGNLANPISGYSFGPPRTAEQLHQRMVESIPAIPVDAITWGPGPGQTVTLWTWMHRAKFTAAIGAAGQEPAQWIPPLLPGLSHNYPRGEFTAEQGPDAIPDAMLRALTAAWHLMQQPTLVTHERVRPDKATMRSLTRAGAGHDVTLIDLRRAYIPNQHDEHGDGEGRTYKHRWVVSGHWRNQPHGPDRAQRRRQWIPAHIKGPDGAPLLATERVNVWRR